MKKLIVLYLVLLFCAFTCKNEVEIAPATANFTIKGGTSFGMCVGYCFTEIEVTSQRIVMTRKAWGRGAGANLPEKICERALSTQEWNTLADAFSKENSAFQKLENQIDCPDCADGGAEWIEITTSENIKRVTFEYNKNVPEISNLITKIREMRESLNKCE
jgi:hypothetical protein